MPMSRGDINQTIARMEKLGEKLRELRDEFQALGDSQSDEICTDPDYTLRRWAGSFAERLRLIDEQRAYVLRIAEDGGDPPKL